MFGHSRFLLMRFGNKFVIEMTPQRQESSIQKHEKNLPSTA